MIRPRPAFTARQASPRVRAFGYQRSRRGGAHQADKQQAGDGGPEGDCETVNHGQDIGFASYERRQGVCGARQSRLVGGAMLDEPAEQTSERLSHLAVAGRDVQADKVGVDLLAYAQPSGHAVAVSSLTSSRMTWM
jgi:hypothetical protein